MIASADPRAVRTRRIMVCSSSSIISSRLPRLSFRGDIPDTEAFKSVFFFELHSGGTPAVVIDP